MKNITTSVCGFDFQVSGVPETLDELVKAAGSEQMVVDVYVNHKKYHVVNTEARSELSKALGEITGIEREVEKVKSPTKSEPDRMVEKFAESEQEYVDRVVAQSGQTREALQPQVTAKAGAIEFKAVGEARVGGPRLAKMDTEYAQKLIGAGPDIYNQAVAKLQQKNPGLTIELDEAGAPKVESLAAALRANRARVEAAEKAELGVAA
jgi:hypothetical protein